MESPGDYLESPMDGDDVAYPCKGCGEILEEGKAFELAGNRWHLNCFRCNTCGTLLDSDANLLLLGDGSLICNNCTYSCSACGNKIEDLAILTGDQAFCATCFRCRNCKRKIENLRYARTSQGIFCMSCHESLMARRRKKNRAAAQSKPPKEKDPVLVDKSLPALPPNARPPVAFGPNPETLGSPDTDTPTELSPRPRNTYTRNDSSSRSSSRRARSPDRPDVNKDSGLTLPTSTYRNNRHSAISQASDVNGGDGESFFIPLALETSPTPTTTPRPPPDTRIDPTKAKESKENKENKAPENDYFVHSKSGREQAMEKQGKREQESTSQTSTPHIAFQEKGRQASSERGDNLSDSPRKGLQSRTSSTTASPATGSNDTRLQHASSNSSNTNGKIQTPSEKFRLQEVPKSKRTATSRNNSQSDIASSLSNENSGMRSASGASSAAQRREPSISMTRNESPKGLLAAEKVGTPRSSQESRLRDDYDSRPSTDSTTTTSSSQAPSRVDLQGSRTITRKEIPIGTVKVPLSSSSADTSSSSASSSDTPGVTPTINGKTISGPLIQSPLGDEIVTPSRALARPSAPHQKLSDSYMAPRAPPAPPPASNHRTKASSSSLTGEPISPKLPRWSAGGDFTMDEDMARILGTDEGSQSILRRVSNAVLHGRNPSEQSNSGRTGGHGRSISETTRTTASPRWPKTPITEDANGSLARDISSPISIASLSGDDPALLRRQLRNSEQRVAELERQFASTGDLQNLNKKVLEKRKTVSVLDSQAELIIRQIEVLAGYVEKAKDTKQPLDFAELEDSSVKEFVQKIERLKQSLSTQIESLLDERNDLIEEKDQAIKDRDRALVEFEQLSSKNAQLADLNNDLTHQIQERFKANTGSGIDSPRPSANGLGIYNHHKEKSVQMEDLSLRSSQSTRDGSSVGLVSTYPQNMDQDDPASVISAPHVINIRKGQVKKFNWKKGGQTVAKGVTKGFGKAFASVGQERNDRWQGQPGDSIGMPYNMTMAPMESPSISNPSSLPRSGASDPRQGGFGLFKKSATMPKAQSNGSMTTITIEHPSNLFGSELVDRAEYERRNIPSVVTRCIEEVELRGMDHEGIYRKTGGSGQVKVIQEGFEKTEDYDISDPGLDITAVTSVLKQYFRKLPTPLLTFDVYDRVLDSISIEDDQERCAHLRQTFNHLPSKHRDCLEFLVFHLARVASRQKENLMTPKNIAVVFAPTIMRDHSLEREMTDMQARSDAVQFVVENSHEIFGGS